jgi:alpha-L-rhamnosidase
VESDQSIQVEYKGEPLESRMQCYWKVRVWTCSALTPETRPLNPSSWSPPAFWEMGLLQPADWQAKWIEAVSGPAEAPAAVPAALSIIKAVYGVEGAETNVTSIVAGLARTGP